MASADKAMREELRKVIEKYQAQIKDWVKQLVSRKAKDDYTTSGEYLEADKFVKSFTPTEGVEYEWIIKYAQESYHQLVYTFHNLDEKADAIIKYLGGGTAAVTLGTLAAVGPNNAWIPLLLLPSLVFALWSIYLALRVRQPTDVPSPPHVTTAIKYANAYGSQAEATFIALWHLCCEGIAFVNGRKARKLKIYGYLYFAAVACLLIPIVVWPIAKLCNW